MVAKRVRRPLLVAAHPATALGAKLAGNPVRCSSCPSGWRLFPKKRKKRKDARPLAIQG
jgi:hypothetical protein